MKPKHFRRRGVSALLSLTLALSSVAAPAFAEDGGESVEGLRFERAEKNYAVTASPLKPPDTVEIRVKLDPGVNARQIIMNNYSTGSEKSWGIEVTAENTLRYWENMGKGGSNSLLFSSGANKIDICTGEWMLISIVRDRDAKKVLTYVNGALAGTMNAAYDFSDELMTHPLHFGTDLRKLMFLKGSIGEVRMWSDERSAAEIAAYANKTVTGAEEGLTHAWLFGRPENPGPGTVFADLAQENGINVKAEGFAFNRGLRFERDAGNYAVTASPLRPPDTVEIRVKLDPGVNARQIIMNNYSTGSEKSWGIEVTAENTLRYWENMGKGGSNSLLFSSGANKIDICTGEWMLISIVRDRDAKKVLTYVNGALAGTMNAAYDFSDEWMTHPLHFGTDLRKLMFLKGSIGEVRMWSDERSAEEIAAYANKTVTGAEEGLTHAWSFYEKDGGVNSETVFRDLATAGGVPVTAAGFPPPPFDFAEVDADLGDLTGVSFENNADQLGSAARLPDIPRTFEATIKLPKDLSGQGGVICGNFMDAGYYDYDLGYVSLEVGANGAPKLYWHQERRNQPNSGIQEVNVGVDLRQDKWVHLAMSFDDAADTVKCYVNGHLVYTAMGCAFHPVIPAQALKIGGDYRGTGGTPETAGYNDRYFKGEIANVSVWSSVRGEAEIAADVAALVADGAVPSGEQAGLLASWSFADSDAARFADLSGNQNDVSAFTDWLAPDFAEGDYSMIALPDTQFLSSTYPQLYSDLTRWIADNEEAYNIKAVMHMGDMVNDDATHQWFACKTAMDILNTTNIPWMPMRGNHDPSAGFNATFPYAKYGANRSWFGGSYEHDALGQDKLDSNYWNVTAGDREYLILSLGWSPSQGAVDWAKSIIEANPHKNVILTAHAFMYWDGSHLNDEDLDWASMYGSKIWEDIGAKYPNVVLAMGGHIGYPDLIARTDQNGAGAEVASLLCDAQGIDLSYGLGMLMMLTFHEGSDTVDINWYSVDEGKLFRERNQFSVNVPHVARPVYAVTVEGGEGSGDYAPGAEVAITAGAAPEGQRFKEWTLVSGDVTLADAQAAHTTFVMPATSVVVKAGFEAIPAAAPTVTGVSVSPGAIALNRGEVFAFTATVEGTNNPDQSVTWSVSGHDAAGTAITSGGALTVAAEETASALTVIATSAFDASKSGTAAVTVTEPPAEPPVEPPAEPPVEPATHTINFNANGGAVSPAFAQTGADGKLSFLPTPARGGYGFDGWYTAASGGSRIDANTVFVSNAEIHAHWTLLGGNGGSGGGGTSGGGGQSPGLNGETVGISDPETPLDESAVSVPVAPFDDVAESAWYHGDVAFVNARGLMRGTSETSAQFSPNMPMSRAMLATVLHRLAEKPAARANNAAFGDVKDGQWYTEAVNWMKESGIVWGTGGDSFNPGGNITRQDLAVILYRYARAMNIDLPNAEETELFADDAQIADYAREALYAMREAGIVGGKPGNIADPKGETTRAEVAAIFKRFIEATSGA